MGTNIIPQMTNTFISAVITAAEPKSFARPDNSCCSALIRSTTASIAEFNNSTIKTKNKLPKSSANSRLVSEKIIATGIKIRAKNNSCLKAASFTKAAL